MSVIETKSRTIAEPRRAPAKETPDRAHAACAHRWIEKRRAHRPERPQTRLPNHAASA